MEMKAAKDMSGTKFVLHGPEESFDPRVTAHRGDLADIALAGKMFAPHYAVPMPMRCTAPKAMIRKQGGKNYQATTELLHGEDFHVLDIAGDWAWGFCGNDGYVGYVPVHALQHERKTDVPTHLVAARAALLFVEPDILSGVLKRLPMGARLACSETSACGNFLQTGKGYVHVRHVADLAAPGHQLADVAEQLIGAPYLWGGRSGDGLDCSGLVQTALALAGIISPRDSDQQMAALGNDLPEGGSLERGDLIFFPGHVGVMVDGENIIHANSHWMQVTTEPLADVIARFAETHEQPVLARRRIA